MVNSGELLQIVRATGELCGKNVSDAAAVMFLADLSQYSGEQIKQALARCRKELRSFPTVADVISRIDDGRPGVEEAWAMLPKSEEESVVWNNEMAEAWAISNQIVDDPVAQRMAFKETYTKIVADARSQNRVPVWTPSLGRNKDWRQAAIEHAVRKGRMTADHAQQFLPDNTPADWLKLGVDAGKLLQHMPKEGQ